MTRLRFSAVFLAATTLGAGACSLVNDLSDYSGGTVVKDSGVLDTASEDSAIDSAVEDTADDTSVGEETAADSTTAETTDDTGGDATGDSTVTEASTDSAPDAALDTAPDVVADVTSDMGSTDAGCGTLCLFGVSEIMVHPVTGSLGADKHEWVELTNYDSVPLDVSGVTVKVFSSTEKGTFTFPAGTIVAAGDAVVIADDAALLKSDVGSTFTLGAVFSFAAGTGDVFVNSAVTIRVYASGSSAAYETAAFSRSTWPTGRSYSYPPPVAVCPASARFSGGVPSSAWKDTNVDVASKYGEFPAGTPLYGTPTKSNTGTACP